VSVPSKQRLPLALEYAFSSGSLLISSVAQLITFAVLARNLGVDQFGVLITITAVTNLGVQLCGLGATETMVRRVAQDVSIYPLALGHNLILMAVSGTAIVTVLTVVMSLVVKVTGDAARNFLVMLVFVLSNVMLVRCILLCEQIYIAHNDYRAANWANVGFALGRTLTALLACYLFATHTLFDWALWHGGGHVVMALACIWALKPLGRPNWGLIPGEIRLGCYFSSQRFFQALRQNVDLLVLGMVAPANVVGSFGVARRILDTSTLTANALHRLTYPALAVLAAESTDKLLDLAHKLLVAVVGIAMLTGIAVYVLAPVLPWLFGKDFSLMVSYTRTLCWVAVLMGIRDVATEALGATSNHGVRAAIYNIGGLIGSLLVALLVGLYWANGAMVGLYCVEAAFAGTFWLALERLARSDWRAAGRADGDSPKLPAFRVRISPTVDGFGDLWPRAGRTTDVRCHVFQCADVLELWRDTMGRARGTELCLAAIFDDLDRPLLLLPLGIERRGPVRILTFLDGDVSDYNTPVLLPSDQVWNTASAQALWQSILAAMPPFDVARLEKMPREVDGRANPLALLDVSASPASGHALDLTRPWDEMVAERFPSRRRYRRRLQALNKLGPVTFEVAQTPEQLTTFFAALIEQKTRRFNETRVPGFEIPGKREFFAEATRRFAGSRRIHVAALKSGPHIIAVSWGLMLDSRLYILMLSYADKPWRQHSPGRCFIEHLLEWCHDAGIEVADFGIGDEAYKLDYTDHPLPLCDLAQAKTPLGQGYLWSLRVLTWLRATPPWRALRPLKWILLRKLRV